jgi:C1A family cysteine protease
VWDHDTILFIKYAVMEGKHYQNWNEFCTRKE